ncbi:MAG: hypothetical protein ACXVH2_10455, partial [Methanobacterium sp.]
MDTKKILKYTGLGIFLLIIIAIVAAGFVFFDVMSYTATGSEKLDPAGTALGKALVVYDPGLSGGAKDAATKIGYNLQSSGYDVILAGVKSSTAANITGYKVIV